MKYLSSITPRNKRLQIHFCKPCIIEAGAGFKPLKYGHSGSFVPTAFVVKIYNKNG